MPIEEVTERVLAACRDYRVLEIAADPYRWAREIQAWAATGLPAAEFPTSSPARMVPARATFYDAVVNGSLTHSGHPALVRHVGNAIVKVDRLGPRIVKEHRGSPRHIDLAVAAVAAYARATYHATEPPPPEPAIIGLWREMAAEAEAWNAAQLPAPGEVDRLDAAKVLAVVTRAIGFLAVQPGAAVSTSSLTWRVRGETLGIEAVASRLIEVAGLA